MHLFLQIVRLSCLIMKKVHSLITVVCITVVFLHVRFTSLKSVGRSISLDCLFLDEKLKFKSSR